MKLSGVRQVLALLVMLALFAVSCGSDDGGTDVATDDEATASTQDAEAEAEEEAEPEPEPTDEPEPEATDEPESGREVPFHPR